MTTAPTPDNFRYTVDPTADTNTDRTIGAVQLYSWGPALDGLGEILAVELKRIEDHIDEHGNLDGYKM